MTERIRPKPARLSRHIIAICILKPLAGNDKHPAELLIDRTDIGNELLERKRRLRHIDQMRGILTASPCKTRCRRDPPGIAPHHLEYAASIGRIQRLGILTRLHRTGRDIFGNAAVTGTVVRKSKVVIDRLGNPHRHQLITAVSG